MTARIIRGAPAPLIDTVGNVLAVPNKIIFLNPEFESHRIGPEVEADIQRFVSHHGMSDVYVRLNRWDPIDEFLRLWSNRRVSLFLRCTFGVLSWIAYCINIGRLFGGDHYNPFTNSVNLYSNHRGIALHELGHVRDFHAQRFPGLYALVRFLPVVSLWQEYVASWYAISYLRDTDETEEELAAYRMLLPAYSTYVFGALVDWFPSMASRMLLVPVIALGHVIGELWAQQRSDLLGTPDRTRARDWARTKQMFSPSGIEGQRNIFTGIGMAVGTAMCGVMAPVGAWVGFQLATDPRPPEQLHSPST